MESSSRNPVPTTFSGKNPIFIQLENDVTRYVQISFAKQVVVAGLSIETLESMALKSFTLSYAGKRIQDPNGISKVSQLFGSSSMVRHSNLNLDHFLIYRQSPIFLSQTKSLFWLSTFKYNTFNHS